MLQNYLVEGVEKEKGNRNGNIEYLNDFGGYLSLTTTKVDQVSFPVIMTLKLF